MSRIQGKNTIPELRVRKYLTANGFRYRLHYSKALGKPDIAFPRKKAAIFVNGCFWHRHGCKNSVVPKTNTDFWQDKLNSNVKRDKRNFKKLDAEGWRIHIIWECELRTNSDQTLEKLAAFLSSFKTM